MTEVNRTVRTYRFKLHSSVQTIVAEFARAHRDDDRHRYREAWAEWLEANKEPLDAERKRLAGIGYLGDVNDKMYKAGRYYFRSRSEKPKTNPPAKRPRRHVATTKEMRDCMDAHIKASHVEATFRPALGFRSFAERHRALIEREGARLVGEHGLSEDSVESKLKRTYKNRYFLVRKKGMGVQGD